MSDLTEKLNKSSFFEDLSKHYDRFDGGHDFLRARLLADIKSADRNSGRSLDNNVAVAADRRGLAIYLSRFAAVAAILVLAFGLAVFNVGNNAAGPSTAIADNVLLKITDFSSVHFNMTAMDSQMEMWWQKPNYYRMQFGDGTVITNNAENYSCKNGKTGEISLKPGLESAGPEMFMLAELGEVFPFDNSPTQQLVKTSKVISTEELIFKGEPCYKVKTKNELSGDLLEYIIDKDQPMIYEISRIRRGKVISHVEVLEIDAAMSDSLFRLK